MKLTQTPSIKRKSGMTLLELTVVILVLLSLISILFVGARAWKKGSDRAANILNLRNIQQAVRGHQNMNNLADGADIATTVIFDDPATAAVQEGYLKEPAAPWDPTVAYTYSTTIPVIGTLFVTGPAAAVVGGTYGHASADAYAAW
jgi:prepilin-type N-terminal cleavage/methylation domain-containing protein